MTRAPVCAYVRGKAKQHASLPAARPPSLMLFLSALVAISVILWRHYHVPSLQQQAEQLRAMTASQFPVAQSIHIRLADVGFRFPDLAAAVQKQLDYRLDLIGCPYRYPIINDLPDVIERPDHPRGPEPVFYTGPDSSSGSFQTNAALGEEITDGGHEKDRNYDGQNHVKGCSGNNASVHPEYGVLLHYWYEPGVWMDEHSFTAHMSYNLTFMHRNDLPFFVTQAIFDTLIAPDLAMWKSREPFLHYVPDYAINVIAAEELGSPAPEILEAIELFLAGYSALTTTHVEAVDVSRKLIPPSYLRNTTSQVTFVFSTSLRPYADHVQGVPVFHLDKLPRVASIAGAEYGTARDHIAPRLSHDAYDISDLVHGMRQVIESSLRLPKNYEHLGLRVHASLKHFAVQGIHECLDLLVEHGVSRSSDSLRLYAELCGLIDGILMEQSHDWEHRLLQVHHIHTQLQKLIVT